MNTSFWFRAGRLWCTVMHGKSMWPSRGYYRCSICLRTYPVRWALDKGFPATRSHVPPSEEGAVSEAGRFVVPLATFGGRKAKLAGTAERWA